MSLPESDADPDVEESPDADAVYSAEDPEDYALRRRLKEVFDLREYVDESRLTARAAASGAPQAAQRRAHAQYRSALEALIIAVRPMMTTAFADVANESAEIDEPGFMYGVELGEQTIHPPQDMTTSTRSRSVRSSSVSPDTSDLQPRNIVYSGLISIPHADAPISVTFEQESNQRNTVSKTESRTVTREIPMYVLDDALALINQFLADAGMDISPEQTQDEHNYDYSDLV